MKEISIERMEMTKGGWSWSYCAAGAAVSSASGAAANGAAIGAILMPGGGAVVGYIATLAIGCLAANGAFH